MKKVLSLLILIVMIMSMFSTIALADDISIGIEIYGRKVTFDVMPVNVNGRVLVPLRGIFETLGANVSWDDATKTVSATREDTSISLTIDKNIATVNGKEVSLDVPATIIESRTLVPVRFVSEALGEKVNWIDSTKTVVIVRPDQEIENTVHRSVPVQFENTSVLNDVINYAGTEITVPDDMKKNPVITPEIIANGEYTFEKGGKAEAVDANTVKVTVDGVGSATTSAIVRLNGFLKDKYAGKDNFIISFSARLISGGRNGKGSVQVQQEHPETYKKSVFELFEFGSEWKKFIFPYTAEADAVDFAIRFGFYAQTIEIKDFYVYNVGSEYKLAQLPSTANDHSHWMMVEDWQKEGSWQSELLKTIEENRKGQFKIVIKDKDGNVIPGAEVELDMFEHEFSFGANLKADDITDSNKEKIASLYNAAVVGSGMEWNGFDSAKVNSQIDFLKNAGIKNIIASPVIKEAKSDIPAELYDNRNNKETVDRITKERIEKVLSEVNADEFILVDDVLKSSVVRNKLGNTPLVNWYSLAENMGKPVMINQDYLASRPSYEQYIDYLIEHNSKPDAIGIGIDFNAETIIDPIRTSTMFDGLNKYNIDIVVTSFAFPNVDGDVLGANFLRYVICSFFANPLVKGVYVEGILSGLAETEYKDLVYNKFWTKDLKVTAGADGVAVAEGFFGDYDVKVTAGGKEKTVSKAFYMGCENVLEIVVE